MRNSILLLCWSCLRIGDGRLFFHDQYLQKRESQTCHGHRNYYANTHASTNALREKTHITNARHTLSLFFFHFSIFFSFFFFVPSLPFCVCSTRLYLFSNIAITCIEKISTRRQSRWWESQKHDETRKGKTRRAGHCNLRHEKPWEICLLMEKENFPDTERERE